MHAYTVAVVIVIVIAMGQTHVCRKMSEKEYVTVKNTILHYLMAFVIYVLVRFGAISHSLFYGK